MAEDIWGELIASQAEDDTEEANLALPEIAWLPEDCVTSLSQQDDTQTPLLCFMIVCRV